MTWRRRWVRRRSFMVITTTVLITARSNSDWASVVEAEQAENALHCNGNRADGSYATANEPVPRNDVAMSYATRFDQLDANALASRLVDADGSVARMQAVGLLCSLWPAILQTAVHFPGKQYACVLPCHNV